MENLLKFGEIMHKAVHKATSIRNPNKFSDLGGCQIEIAIPGL